MSNVIRFLEAMGSSSNHFIDYEAAVAAIQVDESHRLALLQRDHAALNDMLGGRTKMFFGVLAPHEEPFEDEPPFEDQPDDLPEEPAKNA